MPAKITLNPSTAVSAMAHFCNHYPSSFKGHLVEVCCQNKLNQRHQTGHRGAIRASALAKAPCLPLFLAGLLCGFALTHKLLACHCRAKKRLMSPSATLPHKQPWRPRAQEPARACPCQNRRVCHTEWKLCHHKAHLPQKAKVDVTKCHACHERWRVVCER